MVKPFGTKMVDTGSLYGATWAEGEGNSHLGLGTRKDGKRAKLDTTWLGLIILCPVVWFAVMFWIETFRFHYDHPTLIWVVVLVFLSPALFFGLLSCTSRSSDWSKFLAQTFLLAWILAVALGSMNYSSNMAYYYQILNLNTYVMVDPTLPGASKADAGQILFMRGAELDITKAMSVRVGSVFCVAPFSIPGAAANVSRDYWAVGVDCCSNTQPQFDNKCPGSGINRPISTGGLRLIDESNRAYFRMAVQEAEGTYKFESSSPLFFEFTEDPFASVNQYKNNGLGMYMKCLGWFFVLQVFLTFSAFFCFGSMGMRSTDSEAGFYKLAKEEYPEGIGVEHLKALEEETKALLEEAEEALTI